MRRKLFPERGYDGNQRIKSTFLQGALYRNRRPRETDSVDARRGRHAQHFLDRRPPLPDLIEAAVGRMLNMGVDPFLGASSLTMDMRSAPRAGRALAER